MKILRCSICWICFLILCVSLLPSATPASASVYNTGEIKFHLEDGVLTISGKGEMPDELMPWASNWAKIKEIVVEPGITGIGKKVFWRLGYVTSVTLPEGLTYIGEYAFAGCSSLKRINIPASVKCINKYAFQECTALDEVHIADLLAWFNTERLYSSTFIDDKTANPFSLGADLYLNGQRVTNLVIPKGCTYIPEYAFYGCTSIETVTIPRGVTEIRQRAFSSCENLTHLILPGTMERISNSAFYNSDNLRRVTFNGTRRQLSKLEISGNGSEVLNKATWLLGPGGAFWQSALTLFLTVGSQLLITFGILIIRRKRRGY